MPYFPMDMAPVVVDRLDSRMVEEEDRPSSPSIHAPASIQIKNRRKRYLELHPEYFSSELELAGIAFLLSQLLFSQANHIFATV